MLAKPGENSMISERVARELQELLDYEPRIDVERLKYLLEAYEGTEGLPPVIRRARVFEKLCENKTIFIDENPILGTLTQYKFGVYPIPETTGCKWMEGVDRVPTTRGDAVVTRDEMEWTSKAVSFWKGKTVYERTKKIIFERQGVNIGLLQKCGLGTESTTSAFIEGIPDYPLVLRKGLDGLISDIQTKASNLDVGDPDDIEKWYFYQAAATCLNSMIVLSSRYAFLARETAEGTKNRERKTELERIAAVCEWVPKNPARDFREALQFVWFIMLGVLIETPSVLFAPPSRFTQYMYPFYRRERDAGTLTDEEVIELLHFFFIKINAIGIPQSRHGAAWSSSRIGQHLVLGGLMPDGTDATNELDYLVLEAQ